MLRFLQNTKKRGFSMTEREKLYASKLSQMIKCETISEVGVENAPKFEKFQALLANLFPNVFSKCQIVKIGQSLLIKLKGKGNSSSEPILLMSHQDVVPANGKWKHNPFSGDIDENGVIWGRGTVDTKASLMCIFQSLEETIEECYEPQVDVYIATSSTEEVNGDGAPNTVKYLLEHNIRLQFLIDEGGMIVTTPMKGVDGSFAMIGTLEKGQGNIKVIAHSQGGHASTPCKGTPIARLSAFINEIEKHDPNKAKMNPTVTEMFHRLGPHAKGAFGFVLKNAKFFSPVLSKLLPKINSVAAAMIKTTMAFTMCEGSNAENVLPETAWVNINTRFIQHQGVEETKRILEPLCKKYGLEMEFGPCREPQKPVDYNSYSFKLVEETVREIYPGTIPTPYAMTGSTDAYHYWKVTDNAIRFAPLSITQQQMKSVHGIDENINASSLPGGVDFYKAIIRKVR